MDAEIWTCERCGRQIDALDDESSTWEIVDSDASPMVFSCERCLSSQEREAIELDLAATSVDVEQLAVDDLLETTSECARKLLEATGWPEADLEVVLQLARSAAATIRRRLLDEDPAGLDLVQKGAAQAWRLAASEAPTPADLSAEEIENRLDLLEAAVGMASRIEWETGDWD